MTTPTIRRDWSAVAAAWDGHVDDVDEHSMAATDGAARPCRRAAGRPRARAGGRTGQSGRAWSELVGPTGTVVLSDIAPGMVEVARRRNAALDNVEVGLLDASAIDRPDDSFDVVACRMGLMFTPDPAVALRRDPPCARARRARRRAHVGGHRAQPMDDVRRHGGHDERARRAAAHRSGPAASSRSAIRPSSRRWRRARASST